MVSDDIDERQDRMALAAIFQGVLEETLLLLVEKETMKATWDKLKTMYVGTGRVKEARADPQERVRGFAHEGNEVGGRFRREIDNSYQPDSRSW